MANVQEQWENYKQRSKTWSIRITYGLLHCSAFRSLNYAPAIKLLFYSFEKRTVARVKRRGKQKYQIIDAPFSFTWSEGLARGFTTHGFGRAIRELVDRGFWDLVKQGSGLRGDFSEYQLSQRWRKWGQADFESRDLPRRVVFGCFGAGRHQQNQRKESSVVQRKISSVENAHQRKISSVGISTF